MSNQAFLKNFLKMAVSVAEAERGWAVDNTLTIIDSIDVPEQKLASDHLKHVIEHAMNTVRKSNEPELTNDQITREEDIPNTNEYFEMRMILTVPLGEHGAVMIDRLLKNGVFDPQTIEKLGILSEQLRANDQLHLSADEMIERYRSL